MRRLAQSAPSGANLTRGGLCAAAALIVLISCGALAAGPADYPNRPIRLILPFPPGGQPDSTARAVAEQVKAYLNQNIVVDNRAGANGIVAYDLLAKSPPDGYTLVHATGSFAGNASAYRKLPYDTLKDFAPITQLTAGSGYVVLVNTNVPARSLKELIALAKDKDSRLGYGSPGVGNTLHLATEVLKQHSGMQLMHVPFKGTAAGFNALLGNEIQVLVVPPLSALPFVKANRVRALAITGASRWSGMPDLPTVSDSGLPGVVANYTWNGWFAPAKTPDAIVRRLASEIRRALRSPRLEEYFANGGLIPVGSSPPEFQKFVRIKVKEMAEIMRAANVEPQ
jgi:tripartite-type tricarboxylate transporter receptor subunit TctC